MNRKTAVASRRKQAGAIRALTSAAMLAALAFGVMTSPTQTASAQSDSARTHDARPASNSSPIAITSDNRFVWSVNPDNDSVSVFRVAKDKNKKVAEIRVGKEPWCVAITPRRNERDDRKYGRDDNDDDDDDEVKVYVTNMATASRSSTPGRGES
jgi:DNA-binding beta-propeller fold protein YncE